MHRVPVNEEEAKYSSLHIWHEIPYIQSICAMKTGYLFIKKKVNNMVTLYSVLCVISEWTSTKQNDSHHI